MSLCALLDQAAVISFLLLVYRTGRCQKFTQPVHIKVIWIPADARCALLGEDELNRALASNEIVMKHARHCNHSKPPVLDLDELASSKCTWIPRAVERIEVVVTRSTIDLTPQHLDYGDEAENLQETKPEKKLLHRAFGHSNVVKLSHLRLTYIGICVEN